MSNPNEMTPDERAVYSAAFGATFAATYQRVKAARAASAAVSAYREELASFNAKSEPDFDPNDCPFGEKDYVGWSTPDVSRKPGRAEV